MRLIAQLVQTFRIQNAVGYANLKQLRAPALCAQRLLESVRCTQLPRCLGGDDPGEAGFFAGMRPLRQLPGFIFNRQADREHQWRGAGYDIARFRAQCNGRHRCRVRQRTGNVA